MTAVVCCSMFKNVGCNAAWMSSMCLNPALSTIVTFDDSLSFGATVAHLNVAFRSTSSTVRSCPSNKSFNAAKHMILFSAFLVQLRS